MFGLSRILVAYAVAIPLALIFGYILSTGLSVPGGGGNLMMVALMLFALAIPIFIRWHHILLIFFWNAAFNFPFLPAQPHFWLLLAILSFAISWMNGLLGGGKFLRAPALTRPMIFLGIVVVMTGMARGGIGARVFGSASYGGKSYFYIFGAILGYFALTAVRIPPAKAGRLARIYVLSGVTFVLANIAFLLGPAFYFLFYLLPGEFVESQAIAESGLQPGVIERFNGVAPACTTLVCYFLLRWGIRGIFSYAHPWRIMLFVATLLLSLLGGFRGHVIILSLLLICQFFAEGLFRTRFLPILLGFGLFSGVMVFAWSDKLPLAAQRAVCFLPVKVDAGVKADADYSVQWRLEMWQVMVSKIPQYLLVGKGYAIDPDELYFADIGGGAGDIQAQVAMVSGDYHSGPLSTIIPLGLWGVIGLLWLMGAGVKVLYQNHRYGDPALYNINAFFLAFFIAQSIFFFTVFGAFNGQLYVFTGILGMSVSINGGVRKPGRVPAMAAREQAMVSGPVPVQA